MPVLKAGVAYDTVSGVLCLRYQLNKKNKNNAKMWGLKLKLLLSRVGPNFHFMLCAFALNCKNNSSCITKREMFSQCSMFLEHVKSI